MFQSILSSRSKWSTSDDEGDTEPERTASSETAATEPGSSTADEDGSESAAAASLLDEDTVFDLLGNERRRTSLKVLSQNETEWDVNDLSERVAERVADASTSPDEIYNSVYISLCQNHLPTLDEYDLVEYDSEDKTVQIGPAFDHLHRYWFVDREPDESTTSSAGVALRASVLTVLTLAVVLLALPSLSPVALLALFVLHLTVLAVELGSDYFS